MPNNPVQVILNTRDYFVSPDPGRFGPARDFFEDRDQEFSVHRDKLVRQVAAINTAFQRSGMTSGVVKVNLRREAWAKSHRPNRALFPPGKRPCIGVSNLGELYYHVTTDDIAELGQEIGAAETETRRRISSKSGKEYVSPSDQRSDVGGVDSIELPTPSDKRRFGVAEAIHWLSDPRTSGAYFIELFSPPPTYLPELVSDFLQRTVANLVESAKSKNLGVQTFSVDVSSVRTNRPSGAVAFRLLSGNSERTLSLSAEEHSRLLAIFDGHPYVRRVLLPPIVVAARLSASSVEENEAATIPEKQPGVSYPKVGVIDGGIGAHLSPWTIGGHTIVAPDHQQTDHGSFIGGLLVGAKSLNGASVCAEADGCELFDIGILPDSDQTSTFEAYYPRGVVDFLSELDTGVEVAKRDHSIRIFNMSLNLLDPVQDDSYGLIANLLDRIADKHDVLFVISAGNLRPSDIRPEWPSDVQSALQQLASRTIAETILQPAESSRSIAVGALNAPGCAGRVEGVPASYSRRGPGLRVGVKPDVGHIGGSTPDAKTDSGLKSWVARTRVATGHGTSYATPLVAKPLASLDSRVVSRLTREMLIALLIHGSEIPESMRDPALAEVARQFLGFGVPECSDRMLTTSDHAITLVFADVLHSHRELQFDFAWPQCLVNPATGACKGEVRMTLVYRPPLNRDFGAEFVRVNVDAHLRQEQDDTFASRVKQVYLPKESDDVHFEHELIEHGLKWWPIKAYRARFPQGKGKSSNWRLSVESLVRSEEAFPPSGVPFALVLTIADIRDAAPVFNDLRLHLTTRNVQISDIRATTQVRVQP
jgi:hypothetical protein